MLWATIRFDDLKGKKKTIKGDRGKPAENPLMVKSVFSLKHKGSE